MSFVSDPRVRAAQRQHASRVETNARPLVNIHIASVPAPRSRWSRMLVYTLLLAVSVAVIARVIASAIADPLEPIVAGAAPTWMVQVRTTGSRPGTALVYGRDVGVQFLQIPAGDGSTSEARVIPARLAKGELHLITLSWTSLHVFGTGPKGSALLSYGATSPIVTLFQTKESTGVRTGW